MSPQKTMTRDEKIAEAGNALQNGERKHAEELYKEILQAEPENVCALDGLGVLRCQEGNNEHGIALLEQALKAVRSADGAAHTPGTLNARREGIILLHLGQAYRVLGEPVQALKHFNGALKLIPGERDLLLNLGQVHFEFEEYPQAAEHFRTLTDVSPEDASAWLTLGYLLGIMGQYDEASKVLKTAETLDPHSPEVCFYLAESLRKAEQFAESIPYYQRMLPVGAEYPQAVYGYGKSLLALGNFEQGWEAMEFRFASELGTWERHHLPNWSPKSNASRVLAYSEEGIGAELMFASCLPDLIKRVDHCVVECEASLHSLFKRSFPQAEFVPLANDYVQKTGNPWGIPIDAQIAIGSLPRYFRQHREDFPILKAYLTPDRNLVDRWQTRLAGLGDARKVGTLWSGTWTNETPKQTTLPTQDLQNLMTRCSGAAWVNLQHGSRQKDMHEQKLGERRRANVAPHIYTEAFQYDLDSMAALLVSLDLVITPPGYIAHLAGALGVRTWLLLPEDADWRHSIDVSEQRSVWHPSIKMYRQAKGQSWQNFFATIAADLENFLTTNRPPEEIPTVLTLPKRRMLFSRTA